MCNIQVQSDFRYECLVVYLIYTQARNQSIN